MSVQSQISTSEQQVQVPPLLVTRESVLPLWRLIMRMSINQRNQLISQLRLMNAFQSNQSHSTRQELEPSQSTTEIQPRIPRRTLVRVSQNNINDMTLKIRQEIYNRKYSYPVQIRDYNLLFDTLKIIEYYISMKCFGFLGMAVSNSIASGNSDFKFKAMTLHYDIIKYYLKVINDDDMTKNFIRALPTLDEIKEILERKLFDNKEISTIKLILDIYENYFTFHDGPFYHHLRDELIPVLVMFYNSISEDEIKKIYLFFANNKKIKEIYDMLNIPCLFQNRKSCLEHVNELCVKYDDLFCGIDKQKFIL